MSKRGRFLQAVHAVREPPVVDIRRDPGDPLQIAGGRVAPSGIIEGRTDPGRDVEFGIVFEMAADREPILVGVVLDLLGHPERSLQHGLDMDISHALIGGAAMDATGQPLPDETLRLFHRQ